MKKQWVAVFIGASFMTGLVLGWGVQESRSEKSQALVAVGHEAEVAGLCAGVLGATDAGRSDTARKVLEMRLASAVGETDPGSIVYSCIS